MVRPVAIALALGTPVMAAVVTAANLFDWSGAVALLLFAVTCGTFAILAAELDLRAQRSKSNSDRSRIATGS